MNVGTLQLSQPAGEGNVGSDGTVREGEKDGAPLRKSKKTKKGREKDKSRDKDKDRDRDADGSQGGLLTQKPPSSPRGVSNNTTSSSSSSGHG